MTCTLAGVTRPGQYSLARPPNMGLRWFGWAPRGVAVMRGGRLVRDDLAVLLSERFTPGGAARAAPAQPLPAGGPRGPGRLPVSTTSLIGRERTIGEVARLLARSSARLVTWLSCGAGSKTPGRCWMRRWT